jgi:quercetin dioxygenase-like cupin family protein
MNHYPNWKEKIVYGENGPEPQILMVDEKVKIVLAGLKPGQKIPNHPESQAMYHFLEGNGWMTVDNERIAVSAGGTVTMPAGTVRGMEAETQLAFIAVRIS